MPERGWSGSFNKQVLEEASEWFVELNDGEVDARTRKRFGQWLCRSPEHVHAYLNVSAVWADAGVLKRTSVSRPDLQQAAVREPVVLRMPGESLVNRHSSLSMASLGEAFQSVANLPSSGKSIDQSFPGFDAGHTRAACGGRRRRVAIAASIAVLSVATAVFGWLQTIAGSTSYTSDVGERRSITLADGSIVELNSRTSVRVSYSDDSRSVELLTGQALFHVAKDAARPFVVSSDGTRVRAVGTAFDVYQKGDDTIVTVLEGRVDVSEGVTTQRAKAGERVVSANDVVARPERVDVPAATAWTQRRVVFDSVPLGEVIHELNRYRVRPLVLNDDELLTFHISGEFSSENPAGFLQFLQRRFDVGIVETETHIRIEHRR